MTDKDDLLDDDERYEAPAIEFREPLEVLAVACDFPTAKATRVQCPIGPANS